MPHPVLQSSSQGFYIFADDAGAFGEGMAGLSITVSLSKSGGAFVTVSPTITDRGGGVYWIAPLAAHRDTLGEIAWQFAAEGAVIAPRFERVVAVNDQVAAWGANTVAPDNDGIAAAAVLLDEILSMPGPGSGDLPIVPTVKSSGLAVRGVKVTIQGTTRYDTTGEDGTAQLNVESATDDVDYTLLITPPSNYAPVENVVVTVPAGATDPIEVPIELVAVDVIAEPDDPALCNVAVDVITQHGRRPDDAIVWAVPADKLPFAVDSLVVTDAVTYTTNSSGRAVVPLLQGEAVKIAVKFGSVEKVIDFAVPNQPTAKATVRV